MRRGNNSRGDANAELMAKAGWYPYQPSRAWLRYWSGEKWAADVPPRPAPDVAAKPESPAGGILGGLFLALVGSGSFGAPEIESIWMKRLGLVRLVGIGSIM